MNIEGVVLAAGYSSRAGAFKMGLDVGGRSVIQRCVDGLVPLCSRIIVVGGYRIEEIQTLLRNYSKVEVVLNTRYAQGMFTSVKEGVARVAADRFFLTPGDYPFVTPEICRSLLGVEGEIIIPTYRGRKGHPILISGSIAQELLGEDDESNLRAFIQRKGFHTLEVNEEGILLDIDTPDDYHRILELAAKGGQSDGHRD